MATRDLGRLAKRVKARRVALFSSRLKAANAAGLSKDTWQHVEDGDRVHPNTWAKVEYALRWAPGSCEAVAEGGEPIEVGYIDTNGDVTMVSKLPDVGSEEFEEVVRQAAAAAAMATTPDLPVGQLRAFSEQFVENLRNRGSGENRR